MSIRNLTCSTVVLSVALAISVAMSIVADAIKEESTLFGASSNLVPDGEQPVNLNWSSPQLHQGKLQNGDTAPDFTLRHASGVGTVKPADMKGKPVVLIFGSCTCSPFVATVEAIEKLRAAYHDRVHFYVVYIREAHPSDGWAIPGNEFQVKSPNSLAERQVIAKEFAEQRKVSIPILVDSVDDQVEKAYSSWPNRMYILNGEGKIVDKGTAGPGGVAGSALRAPTVLDSLLNEST